MPKPSHVSKSASLTGSSFWTQSRKASARKDRWEYGPGRPCIPGKTLYVAVGTFHGVAIKFVIRAFVLVYKYAVFFERFMAVAVKLLCKAPPGPNGSVESTIIGRIRSGASGRILSRPHSIWQRGCRQACTPFGAGVPCTRPQPACLFQPGRFLKCRHILSAPDRSAVSAAYYKHVFICGFVAIGTCTIMSW